MSGEEIGTNILFDEASYFVPDGGDDSELIINTDYKSISNFRPP